MQDRFSRSFHQMEGICVNFLDQVQFFRFLKGRCHGNLVASIARDDPSTLLGDDVIYTSRAYATMSVSVCLSFCEGSALAHYS